MKFFIISADYPAFIDWFYSTNPEIQSRPYSEQLRTRNDELHGHAGFYSSNFQTFGHEAWDVRANDEVMQMTWAREHGMATAEGPSVGKSARGILRTLRPVATKSPLRVFKPMLRPLTQRIRGNVLHDILRAQILDYKPDVILNHVMEYVQDDFLWEIKPHVRLIVGQIAAPLPEQRTFRSYDLVVSSLPNYVDYFRSQGVSSELWRLGFDPSVLEKLGPGSRRYGATFVGSLSSFHSGRVELLEKLCESGDLEVWGQNIDSVTKRPSIRSHYRGPAWGAEMYRILRDSRITINHHIGIAENYANNLRLFEATGTGAMLLTDAKANLGDMFRTGNEVVTYSTPEECREKIKYYLANDHARETIAQAGQRRTLTEHTFHHRIQELLKIIEDIR